MNPNFSSTPFLILTHISGLATTPMEGGNYMFLHWVVFFACIAAITLLFTGIKNNATRLISCVPFVVLLIVFNPFFPFGIEREDWALRDRGAPTVSTSKSSVTVNGTSLPRTQGNRFSDTLNVRDFGAKGDGSTDDTTAVQSALMAAAGKNLYFPAGVYIVSRVITSSSNIFIYGAGKYIATIKTKQSNASIFSLSGYFVHVEGMEFIGPSTPTSGALLAISGVDDEITSCTFSNYYIGIAGTGNMGVIRDCDFQNPVSSSIGITLDGYSGGMLIENAFMFQPSISPAAGIKVISCGGVLLSNCNIISQRNNLLLAPTRGKVVASVMANNCFFDSAQSHNVSISPEAGGAVVRIYFNQCECSSAAGNGILIDGTQGTVNGVYITEAQANLCTADGIKITGSKCSNIDITGGQFCQNGGAGISTYSSVDRVRINSVFSGSGYGLKGNTSGIYINSGCTNVSIRNSTCSGNTASQIVDASGDAMISDCTGFVNHGSSYFANDMILVTGTFTTPSSAGVAHAITFTKAFPKGCIAVMPTAVSTNSVNAACWVDSLTKTGCNIHCTLPSIQVNYIAIGY